MADQAVIDGVGRKFQNWASSLSSDEQEVLAQWWAKSDANEVQGYSANWWQEPEAWWAGWQAAWSD